MILPSVAFIIALISCLIGNIPLAVPLMIGVIAFSIVALRQGLSIKALGKIYLQRIKQSLHLVKFFILIGCITAAWRASGTIAYLVNVCAMFLHPQVFILAAFVLCAAVSMFLGSSFGVCGTIGLVLMTIGRAGHANLALLSGAILAGSYFGDRSSPTSSCVALVSSLAGCKIYDAVKSLLRSSAIPLLLSIVFYGALSFLSPLDVVDTSTIAAIKDAFQFSWALILPLALILILVLFRLDISITLLFSLICAVALGVVIQNIPVLQMLQYLISGYALTDGSEAARILSGGGLTSMISVICMVLSASLFSGVIEATGVFAKSVHPMVVKANVKLGRYPAMVLVGVASNCLFCSQTLSLMMTHQLMKDTYLAENCAPAQYATELMDTTGVIAPLIPWSVASTVPLALMAAPPSSLLFAFFLYSIPLFNAIRYLYLRRKHTPHSQTL